MTFSVTNIYVNLWNWQFVLTPWTGMTLNNFLLTVNGPVISSDRKCACVCVCCLQISIVSRYSIYNSFDNPIWHYGHIVQPCSIQRALQLKHSDTLKRQNGPTKGKAWWQHLVLLTGAYSDVLDTFPSPVCFLISSLTWKLPWSLTGLLNGICCQLSNQVFSLCQMVAIHQPCRSRLNSCIPLKLSSGAYSLLVIVTVQSLSQHTTGPLVTPELWKWGVYMMMHAAGLRICVAILEISHVWLMPQCFWC